MKIIYMKFRWYFTETNRRDAERFLEQPHNGKGTFLIRPSDTNQGILNVVFIRSLDIYLFIFVKVKNHYLYLI